MCRSREVGKATTYLRAINLGGQSEVVYEPTNKFAIDSAFFEAGMAAKEGANG